jgi:hypothetical protein|tara:strand:- start:93724 stop:94665 length:942 start_codon:yes stop_codon:yes gene_type:complete
MSRPIKKILIIGIGGGADIIGTIPSKVYFEKKGVKCYLAGLPWERYSIDPYPGPRTFESITNLKRINSTLGLVDKNTCTFDGLYFSESKTAKYISNKIYLLNIFNSFSNICDDLVSFCSKQNIDCILGVDVGGDILAKGDEKGLASPLADSIMLSILYKISNKIQTYIGMLGFGSDGELSHSELTSSLSNISKKNGLIKSFGINLDSYKIMKKLISNIETDASRIPILSYEGKFGLTPIRRGRIQVDVHPLCQITFVLNTKILYKNISKISQLISKTDNFFDANEILLKNNYPSEFNYENKKHKESISLRNKE